jgi:hypothetical protein
MKPNKYYRRRRGILRGRFNPRLLPNPHTILRRLWIIYGNTNNNGYWSLCCPFHKDSDFSLSLHHLDGNYFCHECGAKGNILDFYMEVTGKDFIKASTELGAWEISYDIYRYR